MLTFSKSNSYINTHFYFLFSVAVTDSTSNDVSTSDINDLQSPSNGIESEKAVNADGDGNLCAGQSERRFIHKLPPIIQCDFM